MAAKQETGLYCVYFQYRKGTDEIPQIIYRGSQDQCLKYIESYNRTSPEKYRCVLICGVYKEINARITDLKKKYGVVELD
jgi:hypothetical protein